MNKAELTDVISSASGLTKKEANKIIDSITYTIVKMLKKRINVTIPELGTFSVSNKSARIGRDPHTGRTIQLKALKVGKFKASKFFSDEINN